MIDVFGEDCRHSSIAYDGDTDYPDVAKIFQKKKEKIKNHNASTVTGLFTTGI
jgi:hypothetical protein